MTVRKMTIPPRCQQHQRSNVGPSKMVHTTTQGRIDEHAQPSHNCGFAWLNFTKRLPAQSPLMKGKYIREDRIATTSSLAGAALRAPLPSSLQ